MKYTPCLLKIFNSVVCWLFVQVFNQFVDGGNFPSNFQILIKPLPIKSQSSLVSFCAINNQKSYFSLPDLTGIIQSFYDYLPRKVLFQHYFQQILRLNKPALLQLLNFSILIGLLSLLMLTQSCWSKA